MLLKPRPGLSTYILWSHNELSRGRRSLYTWIGHANPPQGLRRHPLSAPKRIHVYNNGLQARVLRRQLSLDALPPFLTPPLVLLGCVLGLYFYKCCMMIIFQNKIIYMPSLPPFSRREKISDYENQCKPVAWEETRIRSLDGTQLALCIGRVPDQGDRSHPTGTGKRNRVVVLYFQGNGSSTPPRLPVLSNVLKALSPSPDEPDLKTDYILVALSYRGYWKSRGRASQRGIELDAKAALAWCREVYGDAKSETRLVLWGQSIGAGVAAGLASTDIQAASKHLTESPRIDGLILETPFISIRSMLTTLYPQKWLPYQYLWPFLRNWWDNEAALRNIAANIPSRSLPILIVAARRDEVVPVVQIDQLQDLCDQLGFDYRRKDVLGALHTGAMASSEGRDAVAGFIRAIANA